MGWGAGRKLWEVLDNTSRVIAVEVLCALQGLEYRAPLQPSAATAAVQAFVRQQVPPLEDDRSVAEEIEIVAGMIRDGTLLAAAEREVGELL